MHFVKTIWSWIKRAPRALWWSLLVPLAVAVGLAFVRLVRAKQAPEDPYKAALASRIVQARRAQDAMRVELTEQDRRYAEIKEGFDDEAAEQKDVESKVAAAGDFDDLDRVAAENSERYREQAAGDDTRRYTPSWGRDSRSPGGEIDRR